MFDRKQRQLIESWIAFSEANQRDPYSQFIALWIAFNAACYGRYARVANRKRADLRQDRGLARVTSTPTRAEGVIVHETGRVRIELENPGRIVITVAERYTEDIIFSQFAKEFRASYQTWLTNHHFKEEIATFQRVLAKGERFYVINMARAREHDAERDYQEMKSKNIIIPFEDVADLKQLKNALYQVRCNIFHGEKVPGEINDDRIVKAAIPVLRKLLAAAYESSTA